MLPDKKSEGLPARKRLSLKPHPYAALKIKANDDDDSPEVHVLKHLEGSTSKTTYSFVLGNGEDATLTVDLCSKSFIGKDKLIASGGTRIGFHHLHELRHKVGLFPVELNCKPESVQANNPVLFFEIRVTLIQVIPHPNGNDGWYIALRDSEFY
ncbi:hypothetical protein H0H92_003340 [Tricholoma furcatifolium]|nr:hypothetical protein H0H92_003340 [Tricholoma furcatifolium]